MRLPTLLPVVASLVFSCGVSGSDEYRITLITDGGRSPFREEVVIVGDSVFTTKTDIRTGKSTQVQKFMKKEDAVSVKNILAGDAYKALEAPARAYGCKSSVKIMDLPSKELTVQWLGIEKKFVLRCGTGIMADIPPVLAELTDLIGRVK